MSLLWLIIVNKLHASVLGRPYMPGLGATIFQHSCSPPQVWFFFSISVNSWTERVSYPSPTSSWTLLCISPGTRVQEFFFHLSQRQIPFSQKERIFFPGFQGWENFLIFLGNKELLHHHFHVSRGPFPGSYASEGVLPLPRWVRIVFYVRRVSKKMSTKFATLPQWQPITNWTPAH